MKVILDLEKYTVEYLETTPFIQGTDSRNKIEVLVPHESTTNVMIAYTLASGRSTIAMANKSLTTITYNSASYDNVLFELPSAVTRLEGNICATVIVTLASDSTKHKFNILNTILNSTDFETFEDALTGIASQVLASLASMNSNVNATATALNNHKNATNNPHSVTKAQVGLGNCNNTSDKDKPISDATQTALDNLQDEIDDLGVIAEMPDKIIDVANCFDFTDDKSSVDLDSANIDKVDTNEINAEAIDYGEDHDNTKTKLYVGANGFIAERILNELALSRFKINHRVGQLDSFEFQYGDPDNPSVINVKQLLDIAQGKTSNYVIDATATGTNITNFEFDNVANTITLDLLDDGNENKLKLVNNTIVSFKDLKIGDIVSVIQNDASDRWVGNITSTQVTFYALETKTDSTPTQNSGNPISSNAIWNIINNGANSNTWHSENTFQGTTELHDVRVDDELLLSDNVEFSVQNFKKIRDRSRDKTLQDSLDQNLYNLGSFDSVSGNVITRQTGYVDLGSLSYQLLGSDYSHYFLSNTTIQNIDTTSREAVCSIYTINNVAYNNMLNMQIRIESNGQITIRNDSYDATTTSGLNAFKGAMSGVILQYKLATSYTETIIENQPLITLDQKGSEWLRDEWEKGLNLFNINDVNNTIDIETPTKFKLYSTSDYEILNNNINWKANTQYTFSGRYTNNGGNVRIAIEYTDGTLKQLIFAFTDFVETSDAGKTINRLVVDYGSAGNCEYENFMIVEGTHPYPYQAYNGHIIHEKDITPVLLWENASPNSSFTATYLSIPNIYDYKYILIAYKRNDDAASATLYSKIKVQELGYFDLTSMINGLNNVYNREFQFANSPIGLRVLGGYYNTVTADNSVIPLAIYGTNVL